MSGDALATTPNERDVLTTKSDNKTQGILIYLYIDVFIYVFISCTEQAIIQMSQPGRESSDEEVYDPESEGPYLSRTYADDYDDNDDEHEHGHNQAGKEFRLIPHNTAKDRWKIYLPVVYWFPKYQYKEWFLSDVIAAITAIVMVIPQGN